jgi:proteasome lid subunit RPN8/RPN11
MPVKDILLPFLTDGPERVGFILKTGVAVEVPNLCDNPEDGFEVSLEDMERYLPEMVATWHTHPGGDCCLSMGDYTGFMNFPDLQHHIVSPEGVVTYAVEDHDLVILERDYV